MAKNCYTSLALGLRQGRRGTRRLTATGQAAHSGRHRWRRHAAARGWQGRQRRPPQVEEARSAMVAGADRRDEASISSVGGPTVGGAGGARA